MGNARVIIRKPFRARILEELHTGHPGIVRMKSLTRFHVWWRLDKEIAESVHDCEPCQSVRNKPPQAPVKPWQRIHIDFDGQFMNKMFLLVVYLHSNSSKSKLCLAQHLLPGTAKDR